MPISRITAASIADGTVVAADIADGTITGAKIAANTIPSANLTTTGVSAGTFGGASQIPVITVDTAGRLSYSANVSIETGFNPFLLSGM